MFREILDGILKRTEGCLGVLIMGFDGLVVERVWQTEAKRASFEIALAEYTALLRNAQRVNSELRLGELHEMTFSGADESFILRVVNNDYFLAMMIASGGNFGRGRYELHRAELLLYKELAI